MLITIRNGAAVLDTIYCKTEHDAQGQLVAFHMGRYYRVDASGSIDVAGASLTLDELWAGSEETRDLLIEGDIEVYLFTIGPAVEFENLLHRLKVAGASILREGRHLGADIDGFQPDWIIKIAAPQDGFASFGVDFPRRAAAPSQQRSESDLRISLLTRENARLRDELDRLRASAKSAVKDAQPQVPMITAVSEPWPPPVSQLPTPISPPPLTIPVPTSRTKVIVQEIESVLAAFCPSTQLLRTSANRLAVEVADRRAFYSALRELAEPRLGSNWKKLKGLEKWFERHVSDGHSDAGRIYARRANQTWEVLFGHKGEQASDIAWLTKQ